MQAYVEYFQTHGQEYVHMIWQHLYLSLLAVGIAAAVGIPCGILSLRAPRIKKILTTGFSVLRIIPSLAVLVILIPIMGVGVKPALTALVILAIPPILIQTTLAFSQVPDFLLEVADAIGTFDSILYSSCRDFATIASGNPAFACSIAPPTPYLRRTIAPLEPELRS